MLDENTRCAMQQGQKKQSIRRLRRTVSHSLESTTVRSSAPRVNRGLKPRSLRPEEIDPEIRFGSPDSRTIWLANRDKPLSKLKVADAWEESNAEKLLNQYQDYLWLSAWLARVTKHPTRARLMAWLLGRFESINADSQHCRAYLMDEAGDRWWSTSMARIAKATLVRGDVTGPIHQLEKLGLIEVHSRGRKGSLIRPLGKPMIRAYFAVSGDKAAEDELKQADDYLQWHESSTRKRIWGAGMPGVAVPDALMVICDHQPGPAALLAHVIYWHSNGRARIVRNGHLWCAKSTHTALPRETGYSRGAIETWCEKLVERGFLATGHWILDRRQDMGRPTLHLRPVTTAIEKALIAHEWDIQLAISNKHA